VTEEHPAAQDLDDARLLDLVRAGDSQAYEVLYDRHEQAARRLARDLVVSPAEIDDVIAETFGRILAVIQRGGGPTDAFRPYVLTAVRRVCYDRMQAQRQRIPTAEVDRADPGDPFVDAAVTRLGHSLIAQAFMSLPERWSAVLWHADIENRSPAEVAPIFGLSVNGVAALHQRARDGLRQAYLQIYLANLTRPACKPVAQRLGGFMRDTLTQRETGFVAGHLTECADCEAVCTELTDVHSVLRGVVAPIFLGSAAASYLTSPVTADAEDFAGVADANSASDSSGLGVLGLAPHAERGRAGGADGESEDETWVAVGYPAESMAAGGAADIGFVADGGPGGPGEPGAPRRLGAAAPMRWIAAGAASIVAVFAIAFAVNLTGHKTPADHGHHHPAAAAAGSPLAISSSAQGSTKPPTASHSPSASPSPSPAPSSTASSSAPSSTPQPAVSTTPPTSSSSPPGAAQLSASVDSNSHGWSGFADVDFQVTDTGSAATGDLTATITLPAGASMVGGGQHAFDNGDGWTCQATSTGATCQHAAIGAGAQTGGSIFISVSTSACGQPVDITAASGSLSATGQSGGIPCGQGD
jgi:RNA polymerase sigma factor (sigma-70 family)